MEPLEYLRAFRRRWAVVAFTVGGAILVAALTFKVVPSRPSSITGYRATAAMMTTRTDTPIKRVAAFVTVGEVPRRAAEAMQYQGDPVKLASSVRSVAEPDSGILRITTTNRVPETAEKTADSFAEQLLGFLHDQATESHSSQLEILGQRIDTVRAEIIDYDNRIADASESQADLLRAERDAKIRRYGRMVESFQELALQGPSTGGFEIIEKASAQPIVAPGFKAPTTPISRTLLAAALGLLGGIVLVLALERVDSKIRTKGAAQKHFGLPVIAEIPRRRRTRGRKLGLSAHYDPRSAHAEAFRLLEAGISLSLNPEEWPVRNGRKGARVPPATILVTSPGPGDGKSTVVTNLAAVMARLGRKVLVVSCDLRRPRVHKILGVSNDFGLSSILTEPNDGRRETILDGRVAQRSMVEGVWAIASGPLTRNPSELIASNAMHELLEEARRRFDVVLLDAAPMLTASDATHLLAEADAVVVIARAGRTSTDQAERVSELLGRFGVRVIGVVLNSSDAVPRARRYYRGRARPTQRKNKKALEMVTRA